MDYNAELIVQRPSTLGEGSIWDARRQVLYWIDIRESQVFIFDPATNTNRAINVGSHVGTVVPRHSGGLILALRDGIASLDLQTEKVEMLVPVDNQPGQLRFNDGKCDPAGRFWVGTLNYQEKKGAASLYRLDIDQTLHRMLTDLTISNGLVWTRDHKTMYFIDTPTREVWAFDYDLAAGAISNKRTVIKVPVNMGYPDGMTIDSDDNIWVALYGGAQVAHWNPKTAELLDVVHVPGAKHVTSCALGGKDLNDLYITTAAQGVDSEADKRDQPHAGSLFRVRVQSRGVEAFEYLG